MEQLVLVHLVIISHGLELMGINILMEAGQMKGILSHFIHQKMVSLLIIPRIIMIIILNITMEITIVVLWERSCFGTAMLARQ